VSARAVIIDCDPGVDDAVALLWALASAEALDVLAITTVAGNVGASQTARNARIIRQIMAREDVPVHAGAAGPLVRGPINASHFHGESGLGWVPVAEPAAPANQRHSVDAIIEAVMSRPAGSVSIAVMGPMTNLALAFRLQPAIIDRIAEVVIMGGARSEGGNITASAEYNVHADPHAAQLVLRSGARCVVMGLDATHQVRATPHRRKVIAGIDTVAARTASGLLDFAVDVQRRLIGPDSAPPLHDPCTIAWLLAPHLFEIAPVDIRVETESPLTLGHTAVEFRLADPVTSRVRWVTGADHAGVFDLLTEALAR
jgi:purine nucleosidase